MADAALADLRAEDVLPELLQGARPRAGHRPDGRGGGRPSSSRGWPRAAKRTETSAGSQDVRRRRRDPHPGRLVAAAGEGRVRTAASAADLYTALDRQPARSTSRRPPRHGPTGAHAGSSFQYGWWSYVDKDIRAVLGEPVQGRSREVLRRRRPHRLPGRPARHPEAGRRADRRPGLPGRRPTARPATSGAPTRSCSAPSAASSTDKISWQNRPTYQQVVEFTSHR